MKSIKNFSYLFVAILVLLIISLSVFAATPIPGAASSTLNTKQIAAPPIELQPLSLPKPAENGVRSNNLLLPITLQRSRNNLWEWTTELSVDDTGSTTITVFSPTESRWNVSLAPGLKGQAALQTLAVDDSKGKGVTNNLTNSEGTGYVSTLYQINAAADSPAIISVSSTKPATKLIPGSVADGYVLIRAEGPYQLYTHLTSYDLTEGNNVAIAAYLYEKKSDGGNGKPAPLTNVIKEANLEILGPNGSRMITAMFDDGMHADGDANDGVFGGVIESLQTGNYYTQVNIKANDAKSDKLLLSGELFFPVVPADIALSDQAAEVSFNENNQLAINIRAKSFADANRTVKVFAELWGDNPIGNTVPVAWFGGVSQPQATPIQGEVLLPLYLHSQWLKLANVSANLELRNVRLQHIDTHIPISRGDRVALKASGKFINLINTAATSQNVVDAQAKGITQEMLMGTPPSRISQSNNFFSSQALGNKLLLVHGYCSEGSVWPTSDFTDYAVFQDFNQNRSHDEFARLIQTFGNQFESFGVVAHSQGGAASLHLYTYYWSGLDSATGNRLIQSVGAPYQGTALAGSLALIGRIFGTGCGENWDLSYSGSALWLAGIPSWAKSDVYYYTTSFKDRRWRYDYCDLLSDVVLSDPDDGVIERWAGQLSGANNMGHTIGQCHTTGMRDPAQYNDHSRNATMNVNAKR